MKKQMIKASKPDESFEFDGSPDSKAQMALMVLATMTRAERLRVVSSILMIEADETGGVKMVVGAGEHEYTITITRSDLNDR